MLHAKSLANKVDDHDLPESLPVNKSYMYCSEESCCWTRPVDAEEILKHIRVGDALVIRGELTGRPGDIFV